jgi:hypothetical protein
MNRPRMLLAHLLLLAASGAARAAEPACECPGSRDQGRVSLRAGDRVRTRSGDAEGVLRQVIPLADGSGCSGKFEIVTARRRSTDSRIVFTLIRDSHPALCEHLEPIREDPAPEASAKGDEAALLALALSRVGAVARAQASQDLARPDEEAPDRGGQREDDLVGIYEARNPTYQGAFRRGSIVAVARGGIRVAGKELRLGRMGYVIDDGQPGHVKVEFVTAKPLLRRKYWLRRIGLSGLYYGPFAPVAWISAGVSAAKGGEDRLTWMDSSPKVKVDRVVAEIPLSALRPLDASFDFRFNPVERVERAPQSSVRSARR